jgi:hypothetical protein
MASDTKRIATQEDFPKTMKSIQFVLRTVAMSLLLAGALAQATTVTGTVTNKTVNKPAAGDPVVLVDVQAGMGEVAHTTTDAKGHYALNSPGSSSYLVRVTHQGSTYFIGAPQGSTPGDLTVYDVAPKVKGVFIEADVLEIETDNDQLKVTERFFVHNTSTPPTTQWSARSFEVVLPAEAVVSTVEAQRPNGLPTSIKLDAAGAKGHYAFNFPIQPDAGDKDTLFQIVYNVPYKGGKYLFKVQESLQTDNLAVLMPKSMTLTPGAGVSFKSVPEDPSLQTLVAKDIAPGKPAEFTISGTGSLPQQQPQQGGQPMGGDSGAQGAQGSQPGGGIGAPINTPDPLSKYKWWILGVLALALAGAAAFLLRKPAGAAVQASALEAGTGAATAFAPTAAKGGALLNVLKDELFALESEKVAGTITPEAYAEVKAALEIVLKRALNRSSKSAS